MGLRDAIDWYDVDDQRAGGVDWRTLAERYGVNVHSLRGRASERRAEGATIIPPRPDVWYERAVDIPTFNDDMAEIQEYIQSLTALKRPALLHITSDEHIGDEDVRALALNILIGRHCLPDAWIMNGDQFDFATVSSFAQARNIRLEDALSCVRPQYYRYVDGYAEGAPGTRKIAMSGNHPARVDRKANEFWQFGDTITEGYAALTRANNQVLWGGWKEEIDVFGLNVRHGERTNMHAAKSTIETDLAYGSSVIFGHTHRLGLWTRTQRRNGRRAVLQSVNIGFGGRNPPAYRANMNGADWIHGSAIAHVYTDDFTVAIQPIVYHETRGGGMVAFVGTQRLEVDSEGREVK